MKSEKRIKTWVNLRGTGDQTEEKEGTGCTRPTQKCQEVWGAKKSNSSGDKGEHGIRVLTKKEDQKERRNSNEPGKGEKVHENAKMSASLGGTQQLRLF